MNKSNIYDVIIGFISRNFFIFSGGDAIDGDASLIDNGIIDSTGILDIIQFIEGEFNISVKEDEVTPENLDSINRICSFIVSKKQCAE